MIELAKIGYGEYVAAKERFMRGPQPSWDELPPTEQGCLEAFATAVANRAIAATRLHDRGDEEEDDPEQPAKQWAVLELMGHRQAIGAITETTIAGRQMITIDRIDTEPAATQHYGPESVYCLTPVTEDQARLLAKSRYKTHIVPPALTAAIDDGDDDDGEGPWDFGEADT